MAQMGTDEILQKGKLFKGKKQLGWGNNQNLTKYKAA